MLPNTVAFPSLLPSVALLDWAQNLMQAMHDHLLHVVYLTLFSHPIHLHWRLLYNFCGQGHVQLCLNSRKIMGGEQTNTSKGTWAPAEDNARTGRLNVLAGTASMPTQKKNFAVQQRKLSLILPDY